MSRSLYSPGVSEDVVRTLYRDGKRRRMPMTRLADELLRRVFDSIPRTFPALYVRAAEREASPL